MKIRFKPTDVLVEARVEVGGRGLCGEEEFSQLFRTRRGSNLSNTL